MNPFGVSDARLKALRGRMERLGTGEQDFKERFIRSGGPGGQNVNKVATCVWLRHLPTGMEVKVQQERSQASNRFLARVLLVTKLEREKEKKIQAQHQRAARIRRQKRRRPHRVQERILASKRLHSLKKRLRAKPHEEE